MTSPFRNFATAASNATKDVVTPAPAFFALTCSHSVQWSKPGSHYAKTLGAAVLIGFAVTVFLTKVVPYDLPFCGILTESPTGTKRQVAVPVDQGGAVADAPQNVQLHDVQQVQ